MPKRKRDDVDEEKATVDRIQDRAIRIKASRLKARIDLGNKSLRSAIQLARGFERQKLGRRQKQASQEPHALLRLREEVILLKELDAGKTARDYLFKQLVRTKKIKESPAFVALYGSDATAVSVKSTAEGNVLGRLFKANPIKEVLPDILKGIRDVLGVDKPGAKVKDETKPDVHGNGDNQVGQSKDSVASDLHDIATNENEDFSGFSDAEESKSRFSTSIKKEHDMSGLEISNDEDEDEMDLEAYNDRLASSSASDESDVDMKMDSDDHVDSNSDSELDRIDESPALSSKTRSKPSTSKRNPPPPPQPLSKTSFLPSLSMGGYYSGSDSDNSNSSPSDGFDPDRAPTTLIQPRKNRRGQRARQQIAEKKYGQNAKHLAKQQQQQNSSNRNQGWDARKGAVGSSSNKDRTMSRGQFGRNGRTVTGPNGDAVIQRSRGGISKVGKGEKEKEAPLHPSWEAARRKKEEAGTVAFKGKKITFD